MSVSCWLPSANVFDRVTSSDEAEAGSGTAWAREPSPIANTASNAKPAPANTPLTAALMGFTWG